MVEEVERGKGRLQMKRNQSQLVVRLKIFCMRGIRIKCRRGFWQKRQREVMTDGRWTAVKANMWPGFYKSA